MFLVRSYLNTLDGVASAIHLPYLPSLLEEFLHEQLYPDDTITHPRINPHIHIRSINVYHSARAVFRAPSNDSGLHGMFRELIRATPNWRRGEMSGPRYDCVYVAGSGDDRRMGGLLIARVHRFISFKCFGQRFPCAIIRWFSVCGNEPDPDNGMWIVTPDFNQDGSPAFSIIHVETILRSAHLLPIFRGPVHGSIRYIDSLDIFHAYYVNRYIDQHAFCLT